MLLSVEFSESYYVRAVLSSIGIPRVACIAANLFRNFSFFRTYLVQLSHSVHTVYPALPSVTSAPKAFPI